MRARKTVIILVAAAAVLGVALGAGPARRAYREAILRRDLARLADVAVRESSAHSRLSVASAPRHVEMRSGPDRAAKPIALYAAADAVLKSAALVDPGKSMRAAGVAHFYIGDYARAVHALEQAAHTAPSASAWSDLAAARLEASRSPSAVLDVLPALVSVDRALAIDPLSPAALYNRATILERMGLRRHARPAWRLALVAESDPQWQEDIRKHLDDFSSNLDAAQALRIVASLPADDRPAVQRAVERFPQEARRYAEFLLTEWAEAVKKGDTGIAETKLRLARALAAALREQSGETLAAEIVAAIDEAPNPTLVSAFATYGEGRALLRARDFAAAEIQLERAASLFARANSAMASVARYNAVTAILEQNRVDEAAARYSALRRAEPAGHRGLTAQLAWQTARTEGIRGHWDAALEAAQAAADGFRSLGERPNTGFMENLLAEIYDYLGQPDRAWAHRLVAFDLLSATAGAKELQVSLGGAGRERIRRKDWPSAIALFDLEIAESQRAGQPVLLADALARRARAHLASGNLSDARTDITSARSASLRVKDPQERARVVATIDAAEGIAERAHDAANSVRLFTSAIDFCERTLRIQLPELYLERGRSQLARNAESEALADFNSGIARLEEQRATLSDFELHSTVADAGEDLYIEAVRVAVRRGDVGASYSLSERSRGRAILSRTAPADARPPTRMPDGTRLVEFMPLPEKLLVFTIDRELRMNVIGIPRATLEKSVASLTAAAINDAPAETLQMAAAALNDALLRPLGDISAGVSTLVFVPSSVLEPVPWAALYDRERKRYLVEDAAIVSAPSATLYAMTASGEVPRARRALIVGNPTFAPALVDLPPLRSAEAEARAIGRYYPERALVLGVDATISRLRREMERSDVIHFAGHAISSEISDDQSFLVLAPDPSADTSGVLYSRDIAKLDLRGVSLVVLAACGTIRGPTVHIDGMPSIGRSFLAAGAKAVIGTLWDIDDESSARLFARIHQRMSTGVPPAEALRDAQLQAIHSPDPVLSHPKTWSGLIEITAHSGTRNAHP